MSQDAIESSLGNFNSELLLFATMLLGNQRASSISFVLMLILVEVASALKPSINEAGNGQG